MFSPLSTLGRIYQCCLDLNLIPSTFLEATYEVSIPPYSTNLVGLSEDMITLS
jgi:hypothetical protein